MARLINTFGDFTIEGKNLARDYQLLLNAYLELHSELERMMGGRLTDARSFANLIGEHQILS